MKMKSTVVVLTTLALPLAVVAHHAIQDPNGIQSTRSRRRIASKHQARQLLTQPLVVPDYTGSFDCYFDDTLEVYICYLDQHDYGESYFVAHCSTEVFDAASCECRLSTQPDPENQFGDEGNAFTFRSCTSCNLIAPQTGGWGINYDCTNILTGPYATYNGASSSSSSSTEETVSLQEDTVPSPAFSSTDTDIDLSLVEGEVPEPLEWFGGEDAVTATPSNGAETNNDAAWVQQNSVPEPPTPSPSAAPSVGVILTYHQRTTTVAPTSPPSEAPNRERGRRNAREEPDTKVRRRLHQTRR